MISVIIPAYNCEQFLKEAVSSATAQSYANLEILILDDCSTDETLATARELAAQDSRIRIIAHETNLGVSKTRNQGLAVSKGEWVAFLDGDDAWNLEKLDRQMARLEETGCDLCYTAYSFMDEKSRPVRKPYHVPESFTWEQYLGENFIGCSTVVFRKPQSIRMRESFDHEDYVFFLELLQAGYRCTGINEPLTWYRISPFSRSGNKQKAARSRWRIYRHFLGLSCICSLRYFIIYALQGIQKHWK